MSRHPRGPKASKKEEGIGLTGFDERTLESHFEESMSIELLSGRARREVGKNFPAGGVNPVEGLMEEGSG